MHIIQVFTATAGWSVRVCVCLTPQQTATYWQVNVGKANIETVMSCVLSTSGFLFLKAMNEAQSRRNKNLNSGLHTQAAAIFKRV